jgi:hypothetical protein
MSYDITIKRGDTRNCIKAVLKDATGNSVDLTGCDVNFYMVPLCGTTVIKRAAHIEDATAGEVWVVWAPGETNTSGIYQAEFKVVYLDGKVETFPSDGYISIQIMNDLR